MRLFTRNKSGGLRILLHWTMSGLVILMLVFVTFNLANANCHVYCYLRIVMGKNHADAAQFGMQKGWAGEQYEWDDVERNIKTTHIPIYPIPMVLRPGDVLQVKDDKGATMHCGVVNETGTIDSAVQGRQWSNDTLGQFLSHSPKGNWHKENTWVWVKKDPTLPPKDLSELKRVIQEMENDVNLLVPKEPQAIQLLLRAQTASPFIERAYRVFAEPYENDLAFKGSADPMGEQYIRVHNLVGVCDGQSATGVGPECFVHRKISTTISDLRRMEQELQNAISRCKAGSDAACTATDEKTAEKGLREAEAARKDVFKTTAAIRQALSVFKEHAELIQQTLVLKKRAGAFKQEVFTAELALGESLGVFYDTISPVAQELRKIRVRVLRNGLKIDNITGLHDDVPIAKAYWNEANRFGTIADRIAKPLETWFFEKSGTSKPRSERWLDVKEMEDLLEKLLEKCLLYKDEAIVTKAGQMAANLTSSEQTADAEVTRAQNCLNRIRAAGTAPAAATPNPLITITKKADLASVPRGETVTYLYEVKNTGNVPLTDIEVVDDKCSKKVYPTKDYGTILNPGDVWQFECNQELQENTKNTAYAEGKDSSGKKVTSTSVSVTVRVTAPTTVKPPLVLRMPRQAAEQYIIDAGLQVGTVTSRYDEDIPKGEVAEQSPSPLTVARVPVGSVVNLVISLGPQPKMLKLWIEPPRVTRTVGQIASFRALVIWNTGREEDVTTVATWTPGPLNTFPCKQRGSFVVSADFQGLSGSATVTCEEDWSVPAFEPPISRAGDRDAKVPAAGPGDYTWYAFCDPRSGEVTYGQHLLTGRKIMAGPFPGPRTVDDWIKKNCSTWRCDTNGACALKPAMGGQWKVLCGRNDLRVVLSQTYDSFKYMLIKEGFLGEPDARAWANQMYPSWSCTETGAPVPRSSASAPRRGGRWAVVCSKQHGGVSLTEYPDATRHWIWSEGFLGEPDARAWANQNCPSWRCDAYGKCLTGVPPVPTSRPPLELPPEQRRDEDWWRQLSDKLERETREAKEKEQERRRLEELARTEKPLSSKPAVPPPVTKPPKPPVAKTPAPTKDTAAKKPPKQEWLSDAEAKALQKELWDTYNKKWCDEWCTHRPKRTKGKVNWSGCAEEPLRALKVPIDMAWWARTREKQGIVRRLAACYDPCVMKDTSPQDRARCYKDCKDRNPMPK